MNKLPNKFTFTHKDDATLLYTANVVEDLVIVTWGGGSADYSVLETQGYINDGDWVVGE